MTKRSRFCRAVQLSGLISDEQLGQVVEAACRETVGPPLQLSEVTDQQIAQQAVRLELITPWQAEQLKKGRTKFTLGEYLVFDEIGKGGMGHVFKAEHQMLGRIEAIKVLPMEKSSPASVASFQREIRAHAQLDHQNLARLTYAGREGTRYFFVTEYVPGQDLRRLVRSQGRLSAGEAATIISQAAQGLQHAHDKGLVHRDIKPGNILVTPEGHCKVIDLGLAGFTEPDLGEDPRAGKIVGTADYLAPEIITSPSNVSAVSEIYTLGCTLYYAVTGKVPYPGGTTAEKMRRHHDPNEFPVDPRNFNPDLDEAFLEVLADMVEKNPEKRIQSAAEVVQRLAPWTLESVPSAQRVEESNSPPAKHAANLALPPLAARPRQQSDFFDEGDVSPASKDSIVAALRQVESGSQTPPQLPPPIDSEDTVKLGLGLYVYPSSYLPPLLLALALVIVGIVLLAKWL